MKFEQEVKNRISEKDFFKGFIEELCLYDYNDEGIGMLTARLLIKLDEYK